MRLAVVDGNRRWANPTGAAGADASVRIGVEDVEMEARRRLKMAKLDDWRTREFVTGRPMPHEIRHFALQVQFAQTAIARLSPIPDDFDSDVYWPTLWV